MRFTREEFDTMVQELLFGETGKSEMLHIIAEKVLRPKIRYWCFTVPGLRNRGYDDDVMQEVHLRLMQKTVSHFLMHEDVEGPYNNNPEGFEDWLYKVALRITLDFAKRVRNVDYKTDNYDDTLANDICNIHGDSVEQMERIERLKEAFSIVLSSDISVYKVLTWLAEFVFILDHNVDKIQANHLILEAFEEYTLFEMYDMLLRASRVIPWIELTEEQDQKIMAALRKKHHGEVLVGEVKYRDFFMKQNGIPSGKKSVSDWMNRMNDIIRRKEEEEKASRQEEQDSGEQSRDEERRRENGASDG